MFPPHCGFSFSRKTILHFKSGESQAASCRRWSIWLRDGRKEDGSARTNGSWGNVFTLTLPYDRIYFITYYFMFNHYMVVISIAKAKHKYMNGTFHPLYMLGNARFIINKLERNIYNAILSKYAKSFILRKYQKLYYFETETKALQFQKSF